MLDGLHPYGLSKYDVRSCVCGLRTCRQVGDRSKQIENRIIIFHIVNCWGNEKIDSYYLLSNSILLINLLILHVKKSFNMFHSNVDSYEYHSDGLQEILSKSSYKLWCCVFIWNFSTVRSCIPQKWNTNHIALKKAPPPPIRLVCCVQLLGVLPHTVTKLCSLQADSSQIVKWNIYTLLLLLLLLL